MGVCLNVGQLGLSELQLCNPEMEAAPVTSGNDTPSAYPAWGLSRVKGPLWSEVTGLGQSRAGIGPPLPCDPGGVGKVAISCSLVIEEITGSRYPFFRCLILQKATPDLPVQLLRNLVLSRGYGLRGKKNILLLKVPMPTQILLTEKGLVAIRMTGGQADLCRVTVPRWAEERGNPAVTHISPLQCTSLWQPGWMYTWNLLSWSPGGSVSLL